MGAAGGLGVGRQGIWGILKGGHLRGGDRILVTYLEDWSQVSANVDTY